MPEGDDLGVPPCYVCRSCGAALEVQVGFKGKVVWEVEAGNPNFSSTSPDLRGDFKEPRLVCSADVMHSTGFQLLNGEIVAEPQRNPRR